MSRSAEMLMIFSVAPPKDGHVWPMVDIGGNGDGGEGSVRWCARDSHEAVRNCSFCSFDDSVGRIVVATHDGKVRVLEMGPF